MSAQDTVTGSFGDYTNADGTPNYGDVGVILNPDGTLSGGNAVGGITGTSASTPTMFDKLGGYLSKLAGGTASAGDYAGLAALIYGLAGGNKPSSYPGWRGKIDPNKYTYTANKIAQPAYVPYSGSAAPVMGRKNFEDATYTVKAAAVGGLMGLAHGGSAKSPRYLQGATDGMADKLSTNIDGEQPAALSHGEFVIPADVVSHLGNGNSEAGANQLYKMMDRIRQARTGNKKQGKRINPEKFTPGGIAGYAGGGVVAFSGNTGSLVTTGQGTANSNPVTSESNLSEWAAPGIVNYIEKGTALSNQPYQAYQGPLSAGISPLQTKAFNTASNLTVPASVGQGASMVESAGNKLGALKYSPTKFSTDQFNTANMQQYMNPYLQMSLDPQIAEARRQAEITQMGNASKLAQAGAYGGSRGALMQSEAQRNLGQNLANITGQGYNTAFDKAMDAFNKQQNLGLQTQQASEASKQFGANFGLSGLQGQANAGSALGNLGLQQNQAGLANLNTIATQGATQRDIEQQGIDALYKQYEQERLDPYKQIQFQQSLYQGLPVSTVTGSTATTGMQDLMGLINNALAAKKTIDG